MLCNSRFDAFLLSPVSVTDYMFIDPPWNYRPTRYSSAQFWNGVTFSHLFQHLNCSTLFIWTTIESLPVMLSGTLESNFELKSLIPYVRTARNEDTMSALLTGFRNPLMYLAVFQRPMSPIALPLSKSFIIEQDNEVQRPIMWEDKMFLQLSKEGFKGIYILPDGTVADTYLETSSLDDSMTRKELF